MPERRCDALFFMLFHTDSETCQSIVDAHIFLLRAFIYVRTAGVDIYAIIAEAAVYARRLAVKGIFS